MADLHLIKVGGNLLEDSEIRKKFLTHFSSLEGPKILVHGGGKSATILAAKMGLEVQMVEGRRITDRAMLEIACMTYAGLLNKSIVSELQALDCNAIGLSGADGNAIRAIKRPVKEIDYGFVGDITKINTALFDQFCQSRIVPVCCALTHDGQGQLLNTNADTLAAAISKCLSTKYKVCLTYCFEKPGVLLNEEDSNSLVPTLDRTHFEALKKSNQIVAGMIPKLTSCFDAIEGGVQEVRIGQMELLNQTIPHTKIQL